MSRHSRNHRGVKDWVFCILPDLPGCIAAGATRDKVEDAMRTGVKFHLEGLRESGDPVPPPRSTATYVEVAA